MSEELADVTPTAGIAGNGDHDGWSYDGIVDRLPHRPPYVLIDRILALEEGRHITCLKNVSGAEPILAHHFPGRAILPGAVLLEMMAQAVLLMLNPGRPDQRTNRRYVPVLAAATVRWLVPVRPGDQVVISADTEKRIRGAAVVRCKAAVGVHTVARARLTVGTAVLEW